MKENTFDRMARLYREGRLNEAAIRKAVPGLLTEEEAESILHPEKQETTPTEA